LAISISLRAERVTERRAFRVALVAAVAGALVVGGAVASRSALFAVRTIEVTGVARLSTDRIVARAHLDQPTNALWLDEGAVERRLERHAWVFDARVSVELPSTVRIAIVERTPIAVATDRFGEMFVAADGTALGRADDSAGLPSIESSGGSRVTAASALSAMSAALRASVTSVAVGDGGTVEIRLRDGPTVHFGSSDRLSAKAHVLERILAWADANDDELAAIDLMAPGAPAVELR
jgi:cell division protein FtsQ